METPETPQKRNSSLPAFSKSSRKLPPMMRASNQEASDKGDVSSDETEAAALNLLLPPPTMPPLPPIPPPPPPIPPPPPSDSLEQTNNLAPLPPPLPSTSSYGEDISTLESPGPPTQPPSGSSFVMLSKRPNKSPLSYTAKSSGLLMQSKNIGSFQMASGLGGPSSNYTSSATARVTGSNQQISLRIHVVTFNMAEKAPSLIPEELFGGFRDDSDIYAIGSQETCSTSEWERLLSDRFPSTVYEKIGSSILQAIQLHVFCRRDVRHLIQVGDGVQVATGLGNVYGNKGGVALSLNFAGSTILIVNCHLAAHDEFVERRNADFHRICARLPAPISSPPPPPPPPSSYPPPPPPRQSGDSSLLSAPLVSSGPSMSQLSVSESQWPSRLVMRAIRSVCDLSSSSSGSFPYLNSSSSVKEQDLPAARESSGIPPGLSALSTNRLHPKNFHPAHGPGSPASVTRFDLNKSKRVESLPAHLMVTQSEGSATSLASSAGLTGNENLTEAMVEAWQAAGREALGKYDMVIFAGDLNYRVRGTAAGVKKAIDKGLLEVLISNDQLKSEQQAGRVLQGFYEQQIHFAPTFKLVKGTDNYNLKRIPSYTDRILFLCNASPSYCTLRPLYYRSINEVMDSDHRPVVGGFEMLLSPYAKK